MDELPNAIWEKLNAAGEDGMTVDELIQFFDTTRKKVNNILYTKLYSTGKVRWSMYDDSQKRYWIAKPQSEWKTREQKPRYEHPNRSAVPMMQGPPPPQQHQQQQQQHTHHVVNHWGNNGGETMSPNGGPVPHMMVNHEYSSSPTAGYAMPVPIRIMYHVQKQQQQQQQPFAPIQHHPHVPPPQYQHQHEGQKVHHPQPMYPYQPMNPVVYPVPQRVIPTGLTTDIPAHLREQYGMDKNTVPKVTTTPVTTTTAVAGAAVAAPQPQPAPMTTGTSSGETSVTTGTPAPVAESMRTSPTEVSAQSTPTTNGPTKSVVLDKLKESNEEIMLYFFEDKRVTSLNLTNFFSLYRACRSRLVDTAQDDWNERHLVIINYIRFLCRAVAIDSLNSKTFLETCESSFRMLYVLI